MSGVSVTLLQFQSHDSYQSWASDFEGKILSPFLETLDLLEISQQRATRAVDEYFGDVADLVASLAEGPRKRKSLREVVQEDRLEGSLW